MTITAYEWGVQHHSCPDALAWRLSLGTATQRTAWRRCHRGDWLWWQLEHGLTAAELAAVRPAMERAANRTVARAIRAHALHCGTAAVERWAARWLDGDRGEAAADAAARAARNACMAAESSTAAAAVRARAVRVARAAQSAARAAAAQAAWGTAEAWAACAAAEAAEAAASDASDALAAELRLQARDLRREIPAWPGEES